MAVDNNVFRVGYGLCKDDWTIEDIPVAAFLDDYDALSFVRMRQDFTSALSRIYYMDASVQDGSDTITVRYIYDKEADKFIKGSEARNIKVYGYHVQADYEDDVGEEYYDYTICLSYEQAKKVQERYIQDGMVNVEIFEDVDIDILEHFWGAGKFFRGNTEEKVLTDGDVFVVDPDGEYAPLITALGGQVIHVGQDKDRLNIIDISGDYGDTVDLAQKLLKLIEVREQQESKSAERENYGMER